MKFFQVTVGSGLPTARQNRFTSSPSLTDLSSEMFTILAGTGEESEKLIIIMIHKNTDKSNGIHYGLIKVEINLKFGKQTKRKAFVSRFINDSYRPSRVPKAECNA